METQRQDFSRKKSLSGASEESDSFWALIVPLACLQKRRLDTTTGAYPAHSQIDHAEEFESTQPTVCKDKETRHVGTRANAADLYPRVGVTSKNTKPVERRTKGKAEASAREKPTDLYASIAEDSNRTRSRGVIRREKGRPESITRVQPARRYIGFAKPSKRTQPVNSDECNDDGGLSECQDLAPTPAFHKEVEDEDEEDDEENNEGDDEEDDEEVDEEEEEEGESFEGHHDTRGSDGDEEYIENDEDISETTSDASSHARKRSRPLCGISRRPRTRGRGSPEKQLGEISEATTSKRKTGPFEPASAEGRRPIKRLRTMLGEPDEEDEEETTDGSLPQDKSEPPLSRRNLAWSEKEEKTLTRLCRQGKSWEYIGGVLGRTPKAAQSHWDAMRKKCHRERFPRVSKMWKSWTEEEIRILFSLRTQGKDFRYISRRIPGRGPYACKSQWLGTKDKDPQEGDSSDRQIAHGLSASQLDQETKNADSTSRSAIVECEGPKSSTSGGSPIDPDDETSAAKPTHEEAMAVRVVVPSSTAGKSPKSKATSANHRNQQASECLAVGEDPTSSTDGSSHQNQPNSQPVIARKDPEIKKEWSYREDLTAGISAQGKQKLGIHRRSYSWS